jgi:hypothetical protein
MDIDILDECDAGSLAQRLEYPLSAIDLPEIREALRSRRGS